MIIATEVIFSLAIALTLSIILGLIMHREVPRSGFFLLFIVIFLFTMAGGLWGKPFGPASMGVFWLPMLIMGLIGGIYIYFRAPRPPPHNRRETIEMLDRQRKRQEMEKVAFLTMDMMLWIILAILVMAIIAYSIRETLN